jgi:hypothetical protein
MSQSSKLSHIVWFSYLNAFYVSHLSYKCHMSRSSNLTRFVHPHDICLKNTNNKAVSALV